MGMACPQCLLRIRVVMKAPKFGQLKANGLWVFHQTDSVTSSKPSNPERCDCPQCLQWVAAVTTRRRLPSPVTLANSWDWTGRWIPPSVTTERRGDQIKGLKALQRWSLPKAEGITVWKDEADHQHQGCRKCWQATLAHQLLPSIWKHSCFLLHMCRSKHYPRQKDCTTGLRLVKT